MPETQTVAVRCCVASSPTLVGEEGRTSGKARSARAATLQPSIVPLRRGVHSGGTRSRCQRRLARHESAVRLVTHVNV